MTRLRLVVSFLFLITQFDSVTLGAQCLCFDENGQSYHPGQYIQTGFRDAEGEYAELLQYCVQTEDGCHMKAKAIIYKNLFADFGEGFPADKPAPVDLDELADRLDPTQNPKVPFDEIGSD